MGLFYEVVFLHTSILFDQYLRCKYCICRFSKKSPNPFPSVCSSSTSHPSCDNLTDSCLSLVSGEQNTFKMLQLNFSISFLCLSVRSLSQYLIRQIMEIPQGRSPLPGRSLCPGRHGGGGQGEGRRAEVGVLRFLRNFQL